MNVADIVKLEKLRQQRRVIINMRRDESVESLVSRSLTALRSPSGVVFIAVGCSRGSGLTPQELLVEDFDIAYPPRQHEPPSAFVFVNAESASRVVQLRASLRLSSSDSLVLITSDRAALPDVVDQLPARNSTLFSHLSHHRSG